MKKNTKFVVAFVLLSAIGYMVYRKFGTKDKTGKKDAISIIIDSGNHSDRKMLSSFESEFTRQWADAINEKLSTFVYREKLYNTKGGTSVK